MFEIFTENWDIDYKYANFILFYLILFYFILVMPMMPLRHFIMDKKLISGNMNQNWTGISHFLFLRFKRSDAKNIYWSTFVKYASRKSRNSNAVLLWYRQYCATKRRYSCTYFSTFILSMSHTSTLCHTFCGTKM